VTLPALRGSLSLLHGTAYQALSLVCGTPVFLPRKQEVARYEVGVKVGKAESTGGGLVRPIGRPTHLIHPYP
jgi:hypothetical protein